MAQNNLGQNQVFPIYQANGQPFHNLSLKKSTLEITGMNLGDKITGDVLYNGTLTFTMREYIEYKRNPDDENEEPVRFILINPPTQTRNGLVKDTSSDAGMTKYTFVFYHPMALLSSFAFNDVAVSDDEKQYLSESRTFSWIGKIPDYCRKLNKNLEGTEWVCYVGSSLDEAMLNKLSDVLSFDNATIADALKTFYDTWEVPYIVDSITSAGQYIDPVTYEDYYTIGKRFVIILGYPSNEIITTTTDVYECNVPFLNQYRNAEPIILRKGAFLTLPGGGSLYTTTQSPQILPVPYTAEQDISMYVVAQVQQTLPVTIRAPYIFQFGQGLGLKNNSRTPKNNKIVTRIVGYGSEDNIPYGYPQIRWYGEEGAKFTYGDHAGTYEDVTIGGIHFDKVVSYPIYKGIVGGQYVELIKHPFTRNHLMPSVYAQELFFKVSPYAERGESDPVRVNVDYDPDTTLIDYYDAISDSHIIYPNPIDEDAPSVEIHQFEDVKPELGEQTIVNAYPYWREDEKRPWYTIDSYKSFIDNLKDTLSTALKGDKLNTYVEMMKDYDFDAEDSDAGQLAYEGDKNDPQFYIQLQPNPTSTPYLWHMDATIKYRLFETETTGGTEITTWHLHEMTLSLDVLRSDATGEPPTTWDDTMDDDGNYIQSYFKMTLPALGFDLYACASITQEMKINMRSGACIGCTFNVMVDWEDYKLNFYDSDGNFAPTGEQRNYDKYPDTTEEAVTFIVQKDNETFGTLMPNVFQQPKGTEQVTEGQEADKFVILGVSLPLTYITSAEQRLDEDMKEYMLENNVYYYEYPLQFDQHFLTTHTGILSQVKQNTIVRFMFGGYVNALYVKQMSIKFGEETLPKYDITLADDIEIVLNQIGQTTEDVSRVRVQMNEIQKYYGDTQSVEIANKLSRVAEDVALGRITFQDGLNAIGSLIVSQEVRTQNFVSGMNPTGSGWRVDENGNAEFASVRVRHALEAATLLINRLQAQEGDTSFSDNDKVQFVQTYTNPQNVNDKIYALALEEKWAGYVTNMQYGYVLRGVINTLAAKQVGVSDEASPEMEYDGNNEFYTSWMIVKGSYSDMEDYPTFNTQTDYEFGSCVRYGVDEFVRTYVFIRNHYANQEWNEDDVAQVEPNTIWVSLYADEQTPSGQNYVPCTSMALTRWGYYLSPDEPNISNAERERRERKCRSFYISTSDGRITKLRAVTQPIIDESNYGTTLGTLPTFLFDEQRYASVAQRILQGKDYLYAQGIVVQDFIKIGADDRPVVNYVDKGTWDANTEYLNSITEVHDVWYNGEGWRCLQTNTGNAPSATSQYWMRLVQRGQSATQYEEVQYAWSDTERTSSPTNPPSVQGWSNNIPQNTSGLAYLWRKSTMWRLQADGTTYVADPTVYTRLSGTDGTSIHTKGTAVDYVSSPPNFRTDANDGDKGICEGIGYIFTYSASQQTWVQSSTPLNDGDAYTLQYAQHSKNGHLLQWSSEANNWLDLGQFKGENGITYYTHVAWAKDVTIEQGVVTSVVGGTIAKSTDEDYPWMGVLVDTNASDSTNYYNYKWRMTKGDTGTSVLAQYSANKTSWHSTFADGDKYMRTSSDSGQTWGEAMQIVGEKGDNGNYTDYTFARSARLVLPLVDVSESDWRDAPPQGTTTQPYIWSKVVPMTWDGTQQQYIAGTATYIRITGEKGAKGDQGIQGETGAQGEKGDKGDIGRNYYYGGEWDTALTSKYFMADDYETPFFKLNGQKWVYIGENFEQPLNMQEIANTYEPPRDNGNWKIMVTDFEYLISKAVFADFANLGSWVFNGDYMYSAKDASGSCEGYQTYQGMPSNNKLTAGFIPSAAMDANNGRTSFSGDKVRFNPDGSGWMADRNIEWNAAGALSVGGGTTQFSTDGSGQLSNGNISWTSDGRLVYKGRISSPYVDRAEVGIDLTKSGCIKFLDPAQMGVGYELPYTNLALDGSEVNIINCTNVRGFLYSHTVNRGFIYHRNKRVEYIYLEPMTFCLLKAIRIQPTDEVLHWIILNPSDFTRKLNDQGDYTAYAKVHED